jgi:3-phosphoshikimate 1-carboxyvinyltransferase
MKIEKVKLKDGKTVAITGSKSISNRLLILGKLFGDLKIENLSNSQDTQLLEKALAEDSEVVDIHHAGTAMRFLTSLFAIKEGKKTILTGSARMKQRPIKPLVDALRELGAEINYLENEGFPPLEIHGKELKRIL